MNLLLTRFYELASKLVSARFATFFGTETLLWQSLDEKEALVRLVTILGQVIVGALYIWGETVRPTLEKLVEKKS